MSRGIRSVLFVALVAFAAGEGFVVPATAAAQSSKKKKKSDGKDEPQRMFEKAEKSLSKGYYDEAIAEFDKLRNTFPFSRFAVEAELKIADAHFKKRDYAEAADVYRTFARLHPKHEKVDYATYRVGLALFLEAPKSVDRDQSSTEKALEEFRSFLTQFPESKYADDATAKIAEGRDRLAQKELYVARYYVKHEKYKAALGRLRSVLKKYPESDAAVEEATFLLGKALFHTKERAEARTVLTAFVEKHPDSEFTREARKLLARIGKAKEAPAATPAASPAATPAATPSP